ncbi:trihelix transcription factor GTL2-like [Vicia villosa]|uniref:trihelix transcription factor GTL2-like n=1 Tax=Vicia villosa TaxID=3911 RepID=UPI00273AC9C5|nr:trihelix transcription factor GTL2-like [Vicia villosa]
MILKIPFLKIIGPTLCSSSHAVSCTIVIFSDSLTPFIHAPHAFLLFFLVMHGRVKVVAANMLDEGVSKQFQFQPMRTTTTSLLHDPFSLQTQSNNNLSYPSILSSLPHHSSKQHHNHTTTFSSAFNFQIQNQLPLSHLIDSGWTNGELLALVNIRSTVENCFPDHLIWDNVSRKLEEVGIKKSADKCKEKFEDENTSLKINNHNDFASELQTLYQHEENSRDEDNIDIVVSKQCGYDDKVDRNRKRKNRRRDRFEMMKCFCETVVNKMMAQQEEIHNKLIQDMFKRDQEKLAREEEWKKQEIERMNMMTQEQAISNHRQSTIIDFLNKHLSTNENNIVNNKTTKACSSSQLHSQNANNHEPSSTSPDQNPSSSETALLVPSTSSNNINNNNKNPVLEDKRRWPRDEVLALINLKCSTTVINRRSNKNSIEKKKEENKGPVWERISEGMSELGYKRSAKRCKEKWENINKYFRKTKDGDVNKRKRRMDSRTCPYFHQLSSLYNQQQHGKVIAPQKQLTVNSVGQIDDQPQAQSD